MLAQVVEYLANVSIHRGEECKAVTGTKLSYHQNALFVFHHRRTQSPPSGSAPEPTRILNQGGGECRERLGIEGAACRVLDRQAVRAEYQDGLDAIPLAEATHHLVEASHQSSIRGEKDPG